MMASIELMRCKTGISACLGHQLVVSARLQDTAGFHHEDAVRAANGGEAMRDHDDRPLAC